LRNREAAVDTRGSDGGKDRAARDRLDPDLHVSQRRLRSGIDSVDRNRAIPLRDLRETDPGRRRGNYSARETISRKSSRESITGFPFILLDCSAFSTSTGRSFSVTP